VVSTMADFSTVERMANRLGPGTVDHSPPFFLVPICFGSGKHRPPSIIGRTKRDNLIIVLNRPIIPKNNL
jgi:hypothetical protein